MKYCPNCGTENKDDARFCLGCGSKFESVDTEKTESVETVEAVDTNFEGSNYYNGDNTQSQAPIVKKSSLGKVAMIVGIIAAVLSVVCCCCYPLGFILGPVAIILGIISLVKHPNNQKGMAITGIILGSIALLFAITMVVISPALLEEMQKYAYEVCTQNPSSDECQMYKENFPQWFQ